MSRSIKGSKGCGYDFWSPRPYSGRGHGRKVKIICHRIERRQATTEILRELRANEEL